MGRTEISPLHATELAEHFGTAIWSLKDIDGLGADDLEQLTVSESDAWSAFTLGINDQHLIVYNPNATEPRVNSVCMHELAHIILGHRLLEAGVTEDGALIPSHYDRSAEDEADWLAGALLLPRPAVLSIRKRQLSNLKATQEYAVSEEMLTWRIRMTGVDFQLASSRRKRQS